MTAYMSKDKAFAATLGILASTFRQQLDAAAIEGYAMALDDLSQEDFKALCKRALMECKFMPSPAELRALVGKAGEKAMTFRTAEAWEAVRKAMDRYDYTANVDFGPHVNAVIRNLGGWKTLCDKSIPDLVWARKDFERLYEAFDGKDMGDRGDFLTGAFKAAPVVQIAIGGVKPPKLLSGPRSQVAEVVRELADDKSAT